MKEKLSSVLGTVQKNATRAGGIASNAAYGVGKKTEALLSTAKINMKISNKQGEVEDLFIQLGQMLYATHTGAPTESDILLDKLQKIDELKAEIAELEVQAGKAETTRTCPVCGAAAKEEDDLFCRECGTKL